MSYPKFAICVLRSKDDKVHGMVQMEQKDVNGPTLFDVNIHSIKPGKHGFHIHKSGNILEGSKTLCSHYNPFDRDHGGRNDPDAHLGDLGNVVADKDGDVLETFEAEFIQLDGDYSIIGRSIIVHQDEDDLGMGDYDDSKTTGHSGKRILWGIIGIDELC